MFLWDNPPRIDPENKLVPWHTHARIAHNVVETLTNLCILQHNAIVFQDSHIGLQHTARPIGTGFHNFHNGGYWCLDRHMQPHIASVCSFGRMTDTDHLSKIGPVYRHSHTAHNVQDVPKGSHKVHYNFVIPQGRYTDL